MKIKDFSALTIHFSTVNVLIFSTFYSSSLFSISAQPFSPFSTLFYSFSCFHSLESKILEGGEFCGFFLCCIPLNGFFLVVVQSLSHVQLFVTQWTAAHQASLSFTISRSLLKLMSIESVMTSNHLVLCHPLLQLSIFPSIRALSNELALCIKWPQYWSFIISPSNEY